MRKLLLLLGSVITTGSFATNVVSCEKTNKYDKKDNGNSYIYYNPTANGTGGHYSTGDAWKHWGLDEYDLSNPFHPNMVPPAVQQTIAQQIMRIFNVAALSQLGPAGEKINPDFQNTAQFKDINNTFSSQWNYLTQIVDNQVDSQKKSQGKNWNKWLKDNYDGSENEYRAYLYQQGSGSSSASSILSDLFANNYQVDYQTNPSGWAPSASYTPNPWSSSGQTNNAKGVYNWIIQSYKKFANNGDDIKLGQDDTWWSNVAYAINAFNQKSAPTNLDDFRTKLKSDIDQLTAGNETYSGLMNLASGNFTYPEISYLSNPPQKNSDGSFNYDYQNIDSKNLNGLLSPSQEFIEANWFKVEHPLAVSQIVIKYGQPASGSKFDFTKYKLSDKNFTDLFTPEAVDDVNTLLTDSENNAKWADMTMEANADSKDDTDISATYEPSLLTANAKADTTTGFANDSFKFAVYNSLVGYTPDGSSKAIKITSDPADLSSVPSSLGNQGPLQAGLARNNTIAYDKTNKELTNNDMFQIYKFGKNPAPTDKDNNIIVYFDSIGMHIVHIDGINSLISPDASSTGSKDADFLKNYSEKKLEDNIWKYKNNTGTSIMNNSVFNNETNSKYLDWLNNNSYRGSAFPTNYAFDLGKELQTFATFDPTKDKIDITSQTMWFWEYKLMQLLLGGSSSSSEDWLKTLMNFPDIHNNDETFNNVKYIFNTQINNAYKSLQGIYETNLNTSITAINNNQSTNKLGPQGTIDSTYNQYYNSDDWNSLWNTWNI